MTDSLSLEDYQKFVEGCIHPGVHPEDLKSYARRGYMGEWGEVNQLLSKALRQVRRFDLLPEDLWAKLVQECGDILHYQVMYALVSGMDVIGSFSGMLIKRDMKIADIEEATGFCYFTGRVPVPDMTIEQLAYLNQQKLLARREELGVFAKE